MKTIRFYYSLGSRYSYLAATQTDALVRDTGCRVDWCPVDGGSLISRKDMNPFAGSPVSGQYDWDYRERDATRWAAFYGVPYVEPRGRVKFDSRFLALAATAAKRLGHGVDYSRELFSAVFAEAEMTQIDRAETIRRADKCGLSEADFNRELDSDATAVDHERALANAHAAGVFGIPSFVVGSEMFWGNDRLVLVRDYLRK